MWDLIVSVPDHCLSFYFVVFSGNEVGSANCSLFTKRLHGSADFAFQTQIQSVFT